MAGGKDIMKYGLIASIVPLSLLGACSQEVAAPAANKDRVLADIHALQTKAKAAANAHDVVAAFSEMAEKYYLVPANEAPSMQSGLTVGFTALVSNSAFATETKDGPGWVSNDGSLAVTTNTRTGTGLGQDGKTVKYSLNQMAVWQKNDAGEWKVVAVATGPGAAPADASANAAE